MIGFEEFLSWKAAGSIPDDIPPLLQALLLDSAGDWDNAHRIAQAEASTDGSWVHAYLHRREGDQDNAAYWYGQAHRPFPSLSLDEEWERMVAGLSDS